MDDTGFLNLRDSFKRKIARIGVIGLGYVGLPLAIASARCGFSTKGFDIDEEKIIALSEGRSYFKHISSTKIKDVLDSGALKISSQFSQLADMSAILICVPTPLGLKNKPDLSYVISTTKMISKYLNPNQLIVLESTTYPGTTAEVLRPTLEASGFKSGKDFFLAYSPEREDPGNFYYETKIIPKVVGADDGQALELVKTLYEQIVDEIIPVSSTDTAEAVKLTENIFRSVNIALINELKVIYDKMGIDVWEVIEAAKTKPFGYMPFYPGPGLGGHCIPIDPFYLTWRAKQFGQDTRFIELAGKINTSMPANIVKSLEKALKNRFNKDLVGASILVLGIAYKKNIDDVRESPAFVIIELLESKGATTEYHDPHVDEIPATRNHTDLAGRRSIELSAVTLFDHDAVLIITDHDEINYHELVRKSRLIIDTRNATRNINDPDGKILRA